MANLSKLTSTLFDRKFVGNPVPIGTSRDRYDGFLMDGEEVRREFKGIRDAMLFTDLRMIVIDPQGVRGKKVSIASIPWKSIAAFSVENSGTFDLEAELKICGSGFGICEVEFTKGTDVRAVNAFINAKVFDLESLESTETLSAAKKNEYMVVLKNCPTGFFKQNSVATTLKQFAGISTKEALESVKEMPYRLERMFSTDEAEVLREQLEGLGVEVEVTQSAQKS